MYENDKTYEQLTKAMDKELETLETTSGSERDKIVNRLSELHSMRQDIVEEETERTKMSNNLEIEYENQKIEKKKTIWSTVGKITEGLLALSGGLIIGICKIKSNEKNLDKVLEFEETGSISSKGYGFIDKTNK